MIRKGIDYGITMLLALTVVLTLAGPQSPVRPVLEEWLDKRSRQKALGDHWVAASVAGGRLDSGTAGAAHLVEFGDYECPFCRASFRIVEDFISENAAVGVSFVHTPLTSIHPSAEGAARAAICAEEQGRFLQMHRALFEQDAWLSDGDWSALAVAVAVPDLAAFDGCLQSARTSQRLSADREIARSLLVTGTPTFVGRKGIRGAVVTSPAQLAALLPSEFGEAPP